MNFEFVCLTDPGRIRDNNEDAVVCDPKWGIAVLADGMGGYNAGEIASAMAVTFVRSELSEWLKNSAGRGTTQHVQRALELCVINANQAIYNAAMSNAQFTGMGTTLVACVFSPQRALIAHVGDSRCYVWRDQSLTQLTRDHSLLQEQMDAGLITPEQAKVATHKNLVTRALGVEDGVLVDVMEHRPRVGDVYLMCSDGLSDMLDDEQIARVMSGEDRLALRAAALIRHANEAGGRDNISVILVRVKAESETSGFFFRILRLS
jgi:protein phosphatase